MKAVTGAHLIAAALRSRGVEVVFGLSGALTLPLFEALDDAGIRIVDTRDERGAAWMAAGYALASGRIGVVVVSGAASFTNAMTPLMDAQSSGIPVLCITGGVALAERDQGHRGDIDQAALAKGWAKWAAPVLVAHDAGVATARGLDIARRGAPGVAILEVPLDMQTAPCEDRTIHPVAAEPEQVDVTAVADLLGKAERPVLIAGEECWWSGAGEALNRFVESTDIPVFTVRAARGLLPDDHPLCMGRFDPLSPAASLALAEADVALIVGARLDASLGGGDFHAGAAVVRVHGDEAGLALGRAADIAVVTSPRVVLGTLNTVGLPRLATTKWVTRLREAVESRTKEIERRAGISSWPLHPGRLVAEVARALPLNAIVCVDAGEFALWALDGIPALAPASLHSSSSSAMGASGMGLPWAIGMKIAAPDRPVVALVGDGSFGFTAIEIETAARHDAPVGVIVGNDGGWGIIRHMQQALHGRALSSDLPVAPYEMLAEFAGAVGDRVETPRQAAIAITNALAAVSPSVVNAIIDRNARHPALEQIVATR